MEIYSVHYIYDKAYVIHTPTLCNEFHNINNAAGICGSHRDNIILDSIHAFAVYGTDYNSMLIDH